MKIAIIALGSRGDVQPYVALGRALLDTGHDVRIVTHEDFAALATRHGLDYRPVRGNVQAAAGSAEMRAALATGNFLRITAAMARAAQQAALQWAEDGVAACRGAELLVAGFGGLFSALALAEKLDLPLVQAHLVPFTPTGDFASVLAPAALPLPRAARRMTHHLTRQVLWQGVRRADNRARRQVLDLPQAPFWGPYGHPRLREHPILHGYSPAVLPKPADWGPTVHVTGYWFLDEAETWTPPPALEAFLADGAPPVYVGFGSMGQRRPAETTALVVDAIRRSGRRAVLVTGWGGLHAGELPDTIYAAGSIPHGWLFPRVAAVIHHGGAGTTAAGLRAGVPSIVVPFFGDQPFWGRRVAELGVGPAPLRCKKLTADRLAARIHRAVSDDEMRRRAAALGEQIRAENGAARAAAIISAIEPG